MPSILVADDDRELRELLKLILCEENYQVYLASDGEEALNILATTPIDILLLDIMMPTLDGLQTAKQVCQRFLTPIIMLTAAADESAKIESFEAGADQYLAKPFSVPELLIRIKSMLRRVALEVERKRFVPDSVELQQLINTLPLTKTESALLNFLMQRKGVATSKKDLQIKVLRREFCEFDRNLDMHISNIRRKFSHAGLSREIIITIRGQGYVFNQ